MMKKLLFTLFMLVGSGMVMAQNTYYWVGTTPTTDYDSLTGWNTAEDGTGTERTVYDAGDVLIVKGSNKVVQLNITAANKELLQLQVLDGAEVTLNSTGIGGAYYFYLKGDDTHKGLIVDNQSTFTLGIEGATYNAINFVLTNGGDINNSTLNVTNLNGKTNRVITKVTGGLVFDNGSICNFASVEGFGQGATASPGAGNLASAIEAVVFKSGTSFYHTGAGNPFAAAADANTKFEIGSYYYYQTNSSLSGVNIFKNRTFANLIIDNGASYTSTSSGDMFAQAATFEVRQNAVFKVSANSTSAVTAVVGADIDVANGATLDLGSQKINLGANSFTAQAGATLGTALVGGIEENIIATGSKTFNGIINFDFSNGGSNITTPFPAGVSQIGELKINSIVVVLNRDITMQGTLNLNGNNSKLYLDASDGGSGYNSYNLSMISPSISTTGNNTYIATRGIGKVNVHGITSSTLIPLAVFFPANNYNYTPVTINPANISNFDITAFRNITNDATYEGTSLSATNKLNKVNTTWIINRTSGSGNCDITLGWANALAGTDFKLLANDKIGVSQYDAVTGYSPYTANTASNSSANGGSVNFSLTNNGGPFVVGEGLNTLPVQLTSFTAQKQGNAAVLKWSTSSENNNSHFNVERSANGTDFTIIASRKGTGTTSVVQQYSYTDYNPISGANYYRLIQYDNDGKTTTYGPEVLSFKLNLGFTILTAENAQQIKFKVDAAESGTAQLKLYAVDGKKILSQTVYVAKGNNTYTIGVPHLASGVYALQYQLGGDVYRAKILK